MANLNDAVKELFELKDAIKEVEQTVSDMKAQRDAKENQILKLMEEAGITEAGVAEIGKVFAKPKTYFSYLKENEAAVISFFKSDEHLRPFVKETIHSKTFQKAIEGHFEQTNSLPEFIKMAPVTELSTRKASDKADTSAKI